jgi:hypothetical protein
VRDEDGAGGGGGGGGGRAGVGRGGRAQHLVPPHLTQAPDARHATPLAPSRSVPTTQQPGHARKGKRSSLQNVTNVNYMSPD